jgi:hypothetical protein
MSEQENFTTCHGANTEENTVQQYKNYTNSHKAISRGQLDSPNTSFPYIRVLKVQNLNIEKRWSPMFGLVPLTL